MLQNKKEKNKKSEVNMPLKQTDEHETMISKEKMPLKISGAASFQFPPEFQVILILPSMARQSIHKLKVGNAVIKVIFGSGTLTK